MPKAKDLETAIAVAQRQAIIEHALSQPGTTIGDLVGLRGDLGALAANITVGELLAGKAGGSGSPRRAAAGRKAPASGRKGVDTKTAAGRKAYDGAILDMLKKAGSPVSAEAIKNEVGGTSLQARTALHRLVKRKKAARSGKARATKYRAR